MTKKNAKKKKPAVQETTALPAGIMTTIISFAVLAALVAFGGMSLSNRIHAVEKWATHQVSRDTQINELINPKLDRNFAQLEANRKAMGAFNQVLTSFWPQTIDPNRNPMVMIPAPNEKWIERYGDNPQTAIVYNLAVLREAMKLKADKGNWWNDEQ